MRGGAPFVSVTLLVVLPSCGGRASSANSSGSEAGAPDGGSSAYGGDAQVLVLGDDAMAAGARDSSPGPEAAPCLSYAVRDAGEISPLEAGACENGRLTSDPGCPCQYSALLTYCTSVGMRCFVPAPGPDFITTDQICVDNPGGMPLWTQTELYTPDQFAALPNEIVLDTADCASRPSLACRCGTSGVTEGFIGADTNLWQCTYNNPVAYVAFTDTGCASRIRYGASPAPDANYASCLTSTYATRRWDCASSGTHLVMSHTTRPLGGP